MLEAFVDVPETDRPFLWHLQAAAEDVVQKWCNRSFALATYDEVYHGSGTALLHLNQRPVTNVAAVRFGLQNALYVQNTDPANYNATLQVTNTGLTLSRFFSGGSATTTFPYADQPTMTAMTAAVNGLGNGWTATCGSDPFDKGWPSSDLAIFPATHGVRIQVAALLAHRWYLQSYRLNNQLGELWGWQVFPRGYQNIRIQYSAGFNPIPDAVQAAVIETVRLTYNARPLNANLQTESLGNWSYTVAVSEGFNQLSGPVRLGLSLYRELAVPRWS